MATDPRQRAVELFAAGEIRPTPDVAAALGVSEDELQAWLADTSFGAAVVAAAQRLLLQRRYPVLLRVMHERATQGHTGSQSALVGHIETLQKLAAESASGEYTVTWGEPTKTAPLGPLPEGEEGE